MTEEGTAFADESQEVVRFAYERFSDHIIVNLLLERHLDANDPKAAFEEGVD